MSNIQMTNRIVQIHLSSWRYFALLSIPPLVLAFKLLCSIESVILAILFFTTHYFCWRLWLDERLFALLNDENDLTAFDAGMARLWSVKAGEPRSLAERWEGCRKLFYRSMLAFAALWLVSLWAVMYQYITLAW